MVFDNSGVTLHVEEKPTMRFSLLDQMFVERGTKEDYEKLHHLHYKSEGYPPAAKVWRCVLGDELIAVIVTSSVSGLLGPRHKMLPKIKPHPGKDTKTTNKYRYEWLNENVRRHARVVTSTMYRGVGVSYRMMNLVSRMEGKRFFEFQSSMAKFTPFDLKSGFVRAPLSRAAAYEKGVKFFRERFDCHPGDYMAVIEELNEQPAAYQKVLLKEMQEFYYTNSAKEQTGQNLGLGTGKVESMTARKIVKELHQLVFGFTVYSIYENPDFGKKLPKRLPLSAFDRQSADHSLKVS